MAVKPITNPNPKPQENLNRANEVSMRSTTSNNGNREQTVIPGANFSNNFEIVLKDLDTALMSHIKNVMKIRVPDNGGMVSVPVMYGNEERWANYRKRGYIRDKNGSLILPLIMLKRMRTDFNEAMPMWQHDLMGDHIEVVRSAKYSKKNQYSRFSVQQGLKPIEEKLITGPPQYVNLNYDFIVWSQYMDQMNTINENFLNQHKRYWGDNTSYRFLTTIEGGINDATEMSAGGERIIRSQFNINLNGYLVHEFVANIVNKTRSNIKKTLTRGRVNFQENTE